MSMFKRKREIGEFYSSKRFKPYTPQNKLSDNQPKPKPTGIFPRERIRIACWNVNGLRCALQKKMFTDLAGQPDLDVLCINETKLQSCHVREAKRILSRYYPYQYYSCSQLKKGYSGTAILCKTEPISVTYGLDMLKYDHEGRVITAEFDKFHLVVVYQPNSGRALCRLDYRVNEWDKDFRSHLKSLLATSKSVCCIGDMNVVHTELDICEKDRPLSNVPGTSQTEKDSFSKTLRAGFVDTFREKHPEQVTFTWFPTETQWRKNDGWRVDYALVSTSLKDEVVDSVIHEDYKASDHRAIEMILQNSTT